MRKVIVVGGGIGGLCTAVRLLKQGYEVTVLEKEPRIGGKVNAKFKNGARFDLTASILMTPQIYTEIFEYAGKDYRDYFELLKIDPIYGVNYASGEKYNFYSDLGKMVKTLESIEYKLPIRYLNFLTKSLEKYLVSKKYFLNEPMIDATEVSNKKLIKEFMSISPFKSNSKYLNSVIRNEQIINYMIFQSMYIGVNPYKNSNIYSLIPAISHVYGLWYIKGGFYKYIEALEKLIYDLGGNIQTNITVEKIMIINNKVKGVISEKGDFKSDIVVCNADYPYAINHLLNNKKKCLKVNKEDYSCSVFIMYLGLNKKYNNLQVHNIYIGEEFKKNIQSPFRGEMPEHPSLYLYYPSKIDDSISGKFESILNIMVRVPNLQYKKVKWDKKNINKFRNMILKEIEKINGLEDLKENILYESYLTPIQLKHKFNSYNGTAFGISHKLNQTTYFRPHLKDEDTKGLYFIGSSTHPGNGVSVIIEGTKILTKLIQDDIYKCKI